MNDLTLREKERIKRRRQILAAARRVFTKRGFYKSTLIEIAREAHLGKTTLYWYFSDKTHLLRAVFEDAIDEQLMTIRRIIDEVPDCRSRVEAIAREQLGHFAKNQFLLRIHGSEVGFPTEEMKKDLRRFLMHKYALSIELLEKVFAAGVKNAEIRKIDVGRMSHLLIAMLHSIAWYWHLRGVKPRPREEARQICDMIFEGLRKGR
jgi:AcrR family transcriptional regulator